MKPIKNAIFCLIVGSVLLPSCGDEQKFSEENKSVSKRGSGDTAKKNAATAPIGARPTSKNADPGAGEQGAGVGSDDVTNAPSNDGASPSGGKRTPSQSDPRTADEKILNELIIGQYLGGDEWKLSISRFTKLR
jgi:hypothetical protein